MSLPERGAWIEIIFRLVHRSEHGMSLPVRGAWIEIGYIRLCRKSFCRRSLRGERGLKFRIGVICTIHICRSLRGERGLKLHTGKNEKKEAASLPERGAWIEIGYIRLCRKSFCRRSLRGERGLKSNLQKQEMRR